MQFNFEVIEKQHHWTQSRMPGDILRVTKNNIAFGESVTKKISQFKKTRDDGHTTIEVGVAYDHFKQALRIFSHEEGFMANVNPDTLTGSFNIPKGLEKYNLPRGDYQLVDGETDVFQLAR